MACMALKNDGTAVPLIDSAGGFVVPPDITSTIIAGMVSKYNCSGSSILSINKFCIYRWQKKVCWFLNSLLNKP